MSKEQAVAFFEEISKNTQLAQKVEKVVREKNSDEAKAKELISLAQRYNFNFTPEEAAVAQGTLKKPLSPDEMLEVSGGKINLKSSLMAMALLAGLGVGSATLTNMDASAMKRTNYSSSSRSSGKRGKTDGQTLENLNVNRQTSPQTEAGAQQQAPPQTVGETNSAQRQTPPSNGQGSTPSNSGQTMRRTRSSRPMTISIEERHAPKPPKEKKARANVEHNKKVAKRYSKNLHCAPDMIERVRSRASSGALPAATWPAFPRVNMAAEKGICRFCGGSLCPTGEGGIVVNCDTAGCVYNWVFHHTGATRDAHQRGQQDYGHYARWALLPALILDSRAARINSTGKRGMGTARSFAIETPADAWAVWQLFVGHNNGWADVRTMMAAHNVDPTIQDEVVRLLEESYDNLILGNESFIDLGSAVQQLVAGYNDSWQQVRAAMDQRGYDENTVNTAIARLEHAYNMLTDEQLNAVGIAPDTVARNPKAALDAIESAHQQFEKSMQRLEAEQQQLAEEARQQAIEKLQHWEALSDDEKKAPGRLAAQSGLVKCRCQKAPGGKGCGSNNISFKSHQCGKFYFQCNECKARNDGSENGIFFKLKPDDLLAMLEAAAPGKVSMEMVPVAQNEQPMQRRQAREEARRQDIEALQRGEQLTVEQKERIARLVARAGLVTCRAKSAPGGKGCGSSNVHLNARPRGDNIQFKCNDCRKTFSYQHADLLAMLQAAAPGNVSMEMADAEQNEQQMGTQDMSQFNPGQQMMTQQNMFAMEMDDEEDYVDRDFYDDEGNPRRLREEKPPEEKEQPENNEERVYESGMMGDQDPSTPMMNQTGFNFDSQWMNQINSMHPIQMNGQNFFTSDLNQRMNEVIDIDAFDNDEENMNDAPSSEKQTRPNAGRRFEMEIEDEYPDEIKEQHKDYENQETNQNSHLQPDRLMILENTNETITPFATENLDDIGDALKNEISNTAPNFARIQSMLQSATKVGANISQLLSFDEVLNQVRAYAKDFGRDDIYALIESWRYSQGK